MNKKTLKDCPFCGGDADIEKHDLYYEVFCTDCMARSEGCTDIEEVVCLWNSRENPPLGLSAVAQIYLEEIFIQSYEAQFMYPDDRNCGEEYTAMREIMGAYYTDEQVEALEIESRQ